MTGEAMTTEYERLRDQYIQAVVDAAPPLTEEQLTRLRLLLNSWVPNDRQP